MAERRALYRNPTTGQVTEVADGDILIGGGGSVLIQVEVDFGFASGNEGDIARTTVTGETWVSPTSVIVCNPFAGPTPDHSGDEVIAEGLVAYAENLVTGVGFDVVAYAPSGTWGRYFINVIGQ
jgi:hypothetical protein